MNTPNSKLNLLFFINLIVASYRHNIIKIGIASTQTVPALCPPDVS